MFDLIIGALTNILIFFLISGIAGGVTVFFLAATWMQVRDERSAGHGKT